MKDDLVTNADLNQFKNEVKKEFNSLEVQMTQNTIDISELKDEVRGLRSDMNEKFDTVITTLDGLAGLITDGRVEKAATESALHRHEAKLDDHEIRIGNLEKKEV
jgi:hypothetical protein